MIRKGPLGVKTFLKQMPSLIWPGADALGEEGEGTASIAARIEQILHGSGLGASQRIVFAKKVLTTLRDCEYEEQRNGNKPESE